MPKPPPPQPNRSNPPGHLGRGFTYALLAHLSALGPLIALALVLGAREAAQRAEEVDVSWETVDPATLPEDLPPIEPPPPPSPEAPKTPKPPKEQVAEVTPEPPPEEPRPPEPEPEPQPEPPEPQPEPRQNRQKAVELDDDTDEPPPDDANFLANRNSRAEVETRAEETNLDRARKGDQASAPSDVQDERPGEAEDKIAQLEDTPSKAGRRAPRTTPSADPQAAAAPQRAAPKSVLSMRDVEKRSHTITPETVNPFLPRTADGSQPLPQGSLRSPQESQGLSGPQMDPRLRLSADDYEYLFGERDEAARALAEKVRSQKKGRFTRRLEQGRSALENFIPEVQPGNQTALNARAAPFAAFIANMHRSIHPLWGWGFLEDLESKGPRDPLNNPALETKVEIVLNADGTIDNVKVIRTSGLSMFDVAAVDVVYSGGPYPEPPREIRSKNGKIYLHWSFARDERQCATFGAEPFILDNPPAGSDRGAFTANPAPKLAGRERNLERLARSEVGHRREVTEASHDPHEGHTHGPTVGEATGGAEGARPTDPLARHAAETFFQGLATGSVRDMVKVAIFPFQNAGSASPSASVLQGQLQSLVQELAAPRKVRSMTVYTSAGLRSAGLRPPQAFASKPGTLYAVALVSGETLIAALQPTNGAWKVAGLFR